MYRNRVLRTLLVLVLMFSFAFAVPVASGQRRRHRNPEAGKKKAAKRIGIGTAIGAGVLAGVLWWLHSTRVYEQADREIAAREQKLPGDTDRRVAAVQAP